MTVEITRLDSGLTVATHPMGHLESAALGVWVKAGARSESDSEHGLSHLLEHMAFKGTSNRSASQIVEEIEAVGGEVNAATSVETTSYYARVLKNDVDLGLDILGDILRNALFDEAELEREKRVILQEIGATLDTPDDRVTDIFAEAAYPGQPIGRNILGTADTVTGAETGMLNSYLNRHYRGPDIVVAASGAVDHDAFAKRVESWFGDLPAKSAPDAVPATYVGGERMEARQLMETQLIIGFEGRSYRSDDFYTAQLLAGILGGGMSSRLFQEIRERRGLCYSIYAFHWSFADTGVFGVHAASSPDDTREMVPVLLDEMDKVVDGITEPELVRARAQLRAGLLMTLENPAARAGQLARQLQLFGRIIPTAELIERTEQITVGDVRRVAREVFTESTPTVAAVGSVEGLPGSAAVAERLAARQFA